MIARASALIAFGFVTLAMAVVAGAEEFEIAGHHLKIETIEGYCAVGHIDPADKLLYGAAEAPKKRGPYKKKAA